MNTLARTALAGLVALAAAPAARADVVVLMSVEGPRGPFSSLDPRPATPAGRRSP